MELPIKMFSDEPYPVSLFGTRKYLPLGRIKEHGFDLCFHFNDVAFKEGRGQAGRT